MIRYYKYVMEEAQSLTSSMHFLTSYPFQIHIMNSRGSLTTAKHHPLASGDFRNIHTLPVQKISWLLIGSIYYITSHTLRKETV
jgi:hypothetical protein